MNTYSIGFADNIKLYIEEDGIYYYSFVENNELILLVCNTNDNTMKYMKQQTPNGDMQEFDLGESLSTNRPEGATSPVWTGSYYKGASYGYGTFKDAEDKNIYTGFVYNGKKIGYGTEFYPDTQTILYRGCFMNDKYHGKGTQFEKDGSVMFEGDFAEGKHEGFTIQVFNHSSNIQVHDLVEELIIGNNCYNNLSELYFRDWQNLKKIEMGNRNFQGVTVVQIIRCHQLESFTVGGGCFDNGDNSGELTIQNCNQLKTISVGHLSFTNFNKAFVLKSRFFLLIVNYRTSSIRIN